MGFGKWVLGGVCAVGAVVAAPVVLPAAGFALASSAVGATSVGLSAGLGMMAASTGTVAATAAAAGAAGVVAGAAQEKKREEAYDKGRRDGNVSASKEYEEKCQQQGKVFKAKIKVYMDKINGGKGQLASYKEESELTEEEIRERDQYELELLEYIKKLEEELSGEDSSTTAWVSEYICDARNFVSAFG